MARSNKRRRRNWARGAVAVAAALLLFGAGWLLGSRRFQHPRIPPELGLQETDDESRPSRRGEGSIFEPPVEASAGSARVAGRISLVFDDLGRSVAELQELEALGVPLTYSVLPFEARTTEVLAHLRRSGKEILCHLPMEAANGEDPGPGALTARMSSDELAAATRQALGRVAGAVGANNHMGSELTGRTSVMRPILEVLAERGLFFVDSRTCASSVGYRLALSLGVPSVERQVFLDSDPDPEAIRFEFRRLLEMSSREGAAVAIAHPYPSTIGVLRPEIPAALGAGFDFVPVSYLLDRVAAPL